MTFGKENSKISERSLKEYLNEDVHGYRYLRELVADRTKFFIGKS